MTKTISDETREYFCYIKQKVRKGEKVIPWLSGTKRKRTMMYKETSRYEKDAKIDYELGVISKEEYEIEMKSVQLLEQAASDEDIKEVNQKIVKQSEPVVKNIMSGKIPKSADIKLSGRGFGSKSSVTSHAADSIPLGAVKVKDTGASADVGWEKSDNSEHFYVKFINWGTIYRPPQEFIYATGREADAELQKIAEQEYQSYLDNTLK